MKTIQAVILHRILRSASYGKTSGKARIIFVRNAIALRPIAEKFDADWKAAIQQLTPDGFADLEAKTQSPDASDVDRRAYYDAYAARDAAADEAMRPFLDSEAEVTLQTLPEEDVADFLESNPDLSMEQLEAVMTHLMASAPDPA